MTSTSLALLVSTLFLPPGEPQVAGWDEATIEAVVQNRIRALQDKTYPDRVGLIQELQELGPRAKSAVPVLIGALKEEAEISYPAARALGKIGLPAIPLLVKAIEGGGEAGLRWAVLALQCMDADARPALPTLVKVIKNLDPAVRVAAVGALSNLPGPESVKALADRAVSDPDYTVRTWAVIGLKDFGPEAKEAVPALIRVMRELTDLIKKGLPDDVLDSGGPRFSHPVLDLRSHVPYALASIGEPAVPALAELLKHPDKDHRYMAILALSFMKPEVKSALPTILKCLNDNEPQIRYEIAYVLGGARGRGDPGSLSTLGMLLMDPSHSVRFRAAQSMLILFPPSDKAMFVLLNGLRDPESDAGKEASAMLEQLKPTEKRLAAAPTLGLLSSPLAPAPLLAASMLFPGEVP